MDTTLNPGAERLPALLSRCLGRPVTPVRISALTGGTYNTAYHVVLPDSPVVLKVAPPPLHPTLRYERQAMHVEAQAMRLARTHTQAPLPDLLGTDFSRTLVSGDALVMAFLPGQPLHEVRPGLSAAQQFAVDQQIGQHLRALHQATGPVFGHLLDSERQHPSWRVAFSDMVGDVLEDARRVGVPLPVAAIRAALARHSPLLDAVTRPSLLLWDSWDGNVFVEPGDPEPRVTGFIDFERALWGDPLAESQLLLRRTHSAFAEGYGQDLLATPEDRLRRGLYDLHLLLVMTVECTYRALGPDSYEAWAREQLGRVLDELQA